MGKVNKQVSKESVLKAFIWYQKETGASHEDCIRLLKNAANSKDPIVRRLAMKALKEVLL